MDKERSLEWESGTDSGPTMGQLGTPTWEPSWESRALSDEMSPNSLTPGLAAGAGTSL